MLGIIALLLIVVFSISITKVATIALTHTGLSRQSARFQARSAFTGVGFTTSESEQVVNHPVRRKILQVLMILGNAGVVTGVTSLIVGFVDSEGGTQIWIRIAVLIVGVLALWMIAGSTFVESRLSNLVSRVLKRSAALDIHDYSSLLHLAGEYRISEIGIHGEHWLKGMRLRNARLRREGVNVLGIAREDGTYIGTPLPDTVIREGDLLIAYGRAPALKEIEERPKGYRGNVEHEESVKEQEAVQQRERQLDEQSQKEESEKKTPSA